MNEEKRSMVLGGLALLTGMLHIHRECDLNDEVRSRMAQAILEKTAMEITETHNPEHASHEVDTLFSMFQSAE